MGPAVLEAISIVQLHTLQCVSYRQTLRRMCTRDNVAALLPESPTFESQGEKHHIFKASVDVRFASQTQRDPVKAGQLSR